jgi:hypothetical protein
MSGFALNPRLVSDVSKVSDAAPPAKVATTDSEKITLICRVLAPPPVLMPVVLTSLESCAETSPVPIAELPDAFAFPTEVQAD